VAPLVATRRIRRKHRHMVDLYLQLLSPWHICPPGSGEFAMPVYHEAAATSLNILRDLGWYQPHRPATDWVAINPGAGWSTRQWPLERFGKLAAEIRDKHGLNSLVFWAGQDELLMASVIAEESRGAAVVAPRTSLCELFELLRLATLLVTSDTGPMHMASALGTPCVGLHGPTWADESGPYGNRHIAVQSPTPHLSKKLNRRGPNLAMQAIELEEVGRACDRLLRSDPAQTRLVA
jgi:heptosyltransferase I